MWLPDVAPLRTPQDDLDTPTIPRKPQRNPAAASLHRKSRSEPCAGGQEGGEPNEAIMPSPAT